MAQLKAVIMKTFMIQRARTIQINNAAHRFKV